MVSIKEEDSGGHTEEDEERSQDAPAETKHMPTDAKKENTYPEEFVRYYCYCFTLQAFIQKIDTVTTGWPRLFKITPIFLDTFL